ncbi:MAG: hypothetical protein MJZ58_06685 [Paludibacteraceae bacterium]|nr:hypothetical protein [Paludibacteraceae bacterium]
MKHLLFAFASLAIVMASCSSSTSSQSSSQTQEAAEVQLPSLEDDGITVFDSYSDAQLKKLAKEDPEYLRFYQKVFKIMAAAPLEKEQRKAFKDLTYRRLYRYATLPKDTAYWAPLEKDWTNEWRELYGYYYYEGADSAAAYWKQVVDEQINCYATIEPKAIVVTGEYDYSLETAYMFFDVTPLKGTITELSAIYMTGLNADNGHNFDTYNIFAYGTIAEASETRSRLGNPDAWRDVALEAYLKDHYIKTEIRYAIVDGVRHDYEDLNVPKGVERLMLEDIPLHRNQAAKYLNPQFVTLKTYLENKKKEVIELADPLSATFIDVIAATAVGNFFRSLQ